MAHLITTSRMIIAIYHQSIRFDIQYLSPIGGSAWWISGWLGDNRLTKIGAIDWSGEPFAPFRTNGYHLCILIGAL